MTMPRLKCGVVILCHLIIYNDVNALVFSPDRNNSLLKTHLKYGCSIPAAYLLRNDSGVTPDN